MPANLAALAIGHRVEFVTIDGDFKNFVKEWRIMDDGGRISRLPVLELLTWMT